MTTTLASLTVDIAGSDSGPSAVLASLPPTTTVTSEIEVVLGTASGGYQPLTIEHLTTGDGGTLYYLSKGYGER